MEGIRLLKHHKRRMLAPRVNRGFLWLTLVILLVGGAISYLLYHFRRPEDLTQENFRLAIASTVVLAGISLVFATASLWMRER